MKSENNIRVTEHLVPMRDGVRLATTTYVPESVEPLPAVLFRSPYGRNRSLFPWARGYPTSYHALAALGYAVVTQDLRGRYQSEGEFDVASPIEALDGADTIAWVREQSWCNGKVGMSGSSYLGFAQFLTASTNPEGLEAILPLQAGVPAEKLFDGVPNYEVMIVLTTMLLADYRKRKSFEIDVPELEAVVDAQEMNLELLGAVALEMQERAPDMQRVRAYLQRVRAGQQLTTDYAYGAPESRRLSDLGRYAPWVRHFVEMAEGDSSYWDAGDYRERLINTKVPVLNVVGWFEAFINGAFDTFRAMQGRRNGPCYKLVVPPIPHFTSEGLPIGEKRLPLHWPRDERFLPAAPLPDGRSDLRARWMARWLKGEDNGIDREAPLLIYVMGDNVWRDEQEWPLARTQWTPIYLKSGGSANSAKGNGRLVFERDGGATSDSYRYDPANPVHSPGGNNLGLTLLAGGFCDQTPIEGRDDVLFYVSDPLAKAIEITGPLTLKLWASTSALATDFIARLVDVEPDGSAYGITAGVARIGEGFGGKAVIPGEPIEIEVKLNPTSFVFGRGHRIRLQVSSSDHPYIDRNPNTGKSVLLDGAVVVAQQTIFHDAERPSALLLPIIPRG